MPAEDAQPSAVRAAKEPGGFWLPNDFVDRWSDRLGLRGSYLYLLLARVTTARHYPSVSHLAARSGATAAFVRGKLALMKSFGLVNDYDLRNIPGYLLHNDVEGNSDAVADDADATEAPDQAA